MDGSVPIMTDFAGPLVSNFEPWLKMVYVWGIVQNMVSFQFGSYYTRLYIYVCVYIEIIFP